MRNEWAETGILSEHKLKLKAKGAWAAMKTTRKT
jgi:hypothetical protein